MGNLDKFYIGGQWVAPNGEARHTLVNQADERAIAQVPMANTADIEAAVMAARLAFDDWQMTTKAHRLALLRRLLDLHNARYDEIAALMTREMGTVLSFS